MTRSHRHAALLSLAALTLLACNAPPPSEVGTDAPSLLTTTSVHLLGDGSSEVSILRETQAERDARLGNTTVARGGAQPEAIVNRPCSDATYSDLYLCDTANPYCSGGNVACFYGYGSKALSTVPRGNGGNWRAAVKQYEASSWSGQLRVTQGPTCAEPFPAGYTITAAGSCGQRADTLTTCKDNGQICTKGSPSDCCSGRCGCGKNPLLCGCY